MIKSRTHFSSPVALGTKSIESMIAATTLTAADNGQTYLLDGDTGFGITLPSATIKGLRFKFITGAAFTTDYVITADPAASLEGCIIEAGAVQDVAAASTITLEDGTENIGDYLEFISTGADWIVSGNFLTAASVTPG